jgi:hypothetical protein
MTDYKKLFDLTGRKALILGAASGIDAAADTQQNTWRHATKDVVADSQRCTLAHENKEASCRLGGRGRSQTKKSPVSRASLTCNSSGSIERLDIGRLVPFGAGRYVKGHLLVLAKALVPFALNRREVCKKVFAAAIWRDETKALAIVEPFNCTCNHVYFSCNDEMTGFYPLREHQGREKDLKRAACAATTDWQFA